MVYSSKGQSNLGTKSGVGDGFAQSDSGEKNIRAFKPDVVPRERIEEILRLTIYAPSAINLQPWEWIVVTGEEKERLSRRLIKAYKEKHIAGSPGNVKPMPKTLQRKERGENPCLNETFFRRDGSGYQPNILTREVVVFDVAARASFSARTTRFPKARIVDVGLALGYFLAELPRIRAGHMSHWVNHCLRRRDQSFLNVPENKNVVIGVALGYPDWESPCQPI